MRKILLSGAVLLTSFSCRAGYTQYQFLAPSSCEAFTISSDAVPPDVNSSRASPEYRAYVAASGANVASFWALYDAVRSTARWADCRETEKDISCIVIGSFNVPSFTCPLGQSKQWSRACTAVGGKAGELKIYSVDTAEYELGGQPLVNQYWQADRAKFEKRCHHSAAPG